MGFVEDAKGLKRRLNQLEVTCVWNPQIYRLPPIRGFECTPTESLREIWIDVAEPQRDCYRRVPPPSHM